MKKGLSFSLGVVIVMTATAALADPPFSFFRNLFRRSEQPRPRQCFQTDRLPEGGTVQVPIDCPPDTGSSGGGTTSRPPKVITSLPSSSPAGSETGSGKGATPREEEPEKKLAHPVLPKGLYTVDVDGERGVATIRWHERITSAAFHPCGILTFSGDAGDILGRVAGGPVEAAAGTTGIIPLGMININGQAGLNNCFGGDGALFGMCGHGSVETPSSGQKLEGSFEKGSITSVGGGSGQDVSFSGSSSGGGEGSRQSSKGGWTGRSGGRGPGDSRATGMESRTRDMDIGDSRAATLAALAGSGMVGSTVIFSTGCSGGSQTACTGVSPPSGGDTTAGLPEGVLGPQTGGGEASAGGGGDSSGGSGSGGGSSSGGSTDTGSGSGTGQGGSPEGGGSTTAGEPLQPGEERYTTYEPVAGGYTRITTTTIKPNGDFTVRDTLCGGGGCSDISTTSGNLITSDDIMTSNEVLQAAADVEQRAREEQAARDTLASDPDPNAASERRRYARVERRGQMPACDASGENCTRGDRSVSVPLLTDEEMERIRSSTGNATDPQLDDNQTDCMDPTGESCGGGGGGIMQPGVAMTTGMMFGNTPRGPGLVNPGDSSTALGGSGMGAPGGGMCGPTSGLVVLSRSEMAIYCDNPSARGGCDNQEAYNRFLESQNSSAQKAKTFKKDFRSRNLEEDVGRRANQFQQIMRGR